MPKKPVRRRRRDRARRRLSSYTGYYVVVQDSLRDALLRVPADRVYAAQVTFDRALFRLEEATGYDDKTVIRVVPIRPGAGP